MREHQIVINLKREQFEEVQRLARLAGSKSVAAYLKERVLEQLALQQNDSSEAEPITPSAHELLEINHELTRMHRELQVFIAESLSTTYNIDESDEDDIDDEIYYAHRNLQQALEEDLEDHRPPDSDTEYSAPSDPYTIVRVPVRQPPPFTLHQTASARASSSYYDPEPKEEPDEPGPANIEPDRPVYIQPDSNQPFETLSPGRYQQSASSKGLSATSSETSVPVPPQQNLNDVSFEQSNKPQIQSPVNLPDAITPGAWSGISSTSAGMYSSSTAESIWLTPPNQVLTPGYQNDAVIEQKPESLSGNTYAGGSGSQQPAAKPANQNPPSFAPGGSTPGGKQEPLGPTNDELENLAERAFAISPRLGAIDKPSNTPVGFRKRQIDDPLDDLIDDKIMEEAEKLRLASVEEASLSAESSVVYAFDSAETEDPAAVAPAQNANDLTVTFPQSEETQSLTNDLALQLQQQSQTGVSEFQEEVLSPDQSYAIDQPTEESPSTIETAAAALATEEQTTAVSSASQDSDGSPPPPAPSMEDSPPPPAPRPDSGTLTGPPPKRRRLPDDQSPDDDERISGGPPPKRRKK